MIYRKKFRFILMAALLCVCLQFLGACQNRQSAGTSDSALNGQEDSRETQENTSLQTGIQIVTGDTVVEQDGEVAEETRESLTLTMLDVGQGLSVLIEADGHYMIYDGGGRSTSSYVVAFLKGQGVEQLDYLVASHYDEDHLAGLVGCLNVFPTSVILCPDYQKDTTIYASFQKKVLEVTEGEQKAGTQLIHPQVGDSWKLGSARLTLLGPVSQARRRTIILWSFGLTTENSAVF